MILPKEYRCSHFYKTITYFRMTLTSDPSMDTGDNVYGGCEGPDAM